MSITYSVGITGAKVNAKQRGQGQGSMRWDRCFLRCSASTAQESLRPGSAFISRTWGSGR